MPFTFTQRKITFPGMSDLDILLAAYGITVVPEGSQYKATFVRPGKKYNGMTYVHRTPTKAAVALIHAGAPLGGMCTTPEWQRRIDNIPTKTYQVGGMKIDMYRRGF